jgi:ribosomal protein S18 acetylase RimI-like enzyme
MDMVKPDLNSSCNFKIVVAEPFHLKQMVDCHIKAFPGEFMTLLGPHVIKSFYDFYIRSKDGIVFVAMNNTGQVIGFVLGGAPELRSRFNRRRLPLHIFSILLASVKSGFARKRLCQHIHAAASRFGLLVRGKGNVGTVHEPPQDPPGTWSTLLSICTDPGFRGRGIGKNLMEAFHLESRKRGYQTMRLSVHLDNENAIKLYRGCGWDPVLKTPDGIYFKKRIKD